MQDICRPIRTPAPSHGKCGLANHFIGLSAAIGVQSTGNDWHAETWHVRHLLYVYFRLRTAHCAKEIGAYTLYGRYIGYLSQPHIASDFLCFERR